MSQKHSQRLRHRSSRRLQLENLELRAVMFAGDLDTEFAAAGLLRLPTSFSASNTISPYSENAANGIYVQDHLNPTGSIQRFDLTGAVDPDFGLGSPISIANDTTAVQSTGHVVALDSTRPPDAFVVSTTTSTTTTPTIASVPSTFGLVVGMAVNDVPNGIDYGFIVSIDRVNNTIELSQDAPLDGTTDLTYTGLTRGFDVSLSRFDSFGDQDFGFGTTGTFGVTNLDFSSETTYGVDLPVQRITEETSPVAVKVESGTDKLWVLTGGDLKLTSSSEYRPSYYFGLARLNATGTPDNSFSQNGLFIHEFVSASPTNIESFVPTDLVLTQNGGALVVGFLTDIDFSDPEAPTATNTLVAVRVTSTGQLDTSFGTGGRLTLSAVGQVADAGKVRAALDPSTGKFVLGFYHPTGNPNEFELQLARISPTGVLDTTYGTNGVIATGHLEIVTGFTAMDEFGLAVQKTDEKTVIAMGNPTWIVRRYTRTGTPDASFGTNGEVITELSANSADLAIPTDLDIQFDGKIVVTGAFIPQTGGQEIVVARYVPQDIGNTDALSSVLTLPSNVFTNQFTVSWSGTATAGIKNYDIWYVIDGGTPVLWQPATTATSAVFNLPAVSYTHLTLPTSDLV